MCCLLSGTDRQIYLRQRMRTQGQFSLQVFNLLISPCGFIIKFLFGSTQLCLVFLLHLVVFTVRIGMEITHHLG